MLTIKYSESTPPSLLTEVEERLQNLALAYQKDESENLDEPIALHDDKEYVGKEAVMNKLTNLEEEMKSWWYCAC
ncbi:MAG: hypothetical protein AAGG68_05385 [Bacteroidota bacterium]